jgi:AcrR family transcriptional regulator
MQKISSKISDLNRAPSKSERTRAAILAAARELFAKLGYERTTVRGIAARASIDPAMVMRYFGSKDGLFAEATVFDLKLPDLTAIDPLQLGPTLIAHFLALWEGSLNQGTLTILLRAAASNDDAAAKMRSIFAGQVMPMLAQVTDRSELGPRAGLISSQLLGIALCRYVLKVPPIVAMKPELIVSSVGPTLQQYITGKLW